MKVVVTGAAGFLGSRLADFLLSDESPLRVTELVLTDAAEPAARSDTRVRSLALDLTAAGAARRLLDPATGAVFHLAAVVSGAAEADFDLGLAVNLDATRALLEAARALCPAARFVFASTLAVFGGSPPAPVTERTAMTPQTSYGAAKAAAELLVCEYARRGFADARVVRLPTVTVRGDAANAAMTSFASAVIRSPLAGRAARMPVPAEQQLWVTSPRAAVRNLARVGALPAAALVAGGAAPVVHLPGLRVSVREMVRALEAAAGAEVAARVSFQPDERIARMVATLPVDFCNQRALALGLEVDASFADIVNVYVRDHPAISS